MGSRHGALQVVFSYDAFHLTWFAAVHCVCREQVPLDELLDDLEGLNIGSEEEHAHAQQPSSDVEMMDH